MTTTPVLTGRHIGEAENAIRALLDRQLEEASLSFPEWTVLLTLGGADPLPRSELVRRQAYGLKVSEAAARATVDGRRSSAPRPAAHPDGGRSGQVPARPSGRVPHRRRALRRPATGRPRGDPPHPGRGDPPGQRPPGRRRLSVDALIA